MPGEMQNFRRDAGPLLETYRSIDLRVVADRLPDGRWRVLRLRALLTPDEHMEVVSDLPSIPDLFVAHHRVPSSALEVLLTGLEAGRLDIGGATVHPQQDAGNNTWRPLSYHPQAYERNAALGEFRLDRRVVALQGYGSWSNSGQWYRDRDRLSAALRNATPPWDGLSELYKGFMGETAPTGDLNDSRTWVLAPLPLRFLEARIGPALSVEVEGVSTIDSSQAILAAIFSMEGKTVSRVRTSLEEAVEHDGNVYKLVLPLPREFSGIVFALTYRGLDADRREMFRPGHGGPPRSWSVLARTIGTHEEFFDRLERIDGGDPLEHWVSVLFHLLGFSVVHFGKSAFSTDTADILAFSPDGNWTCVIEATAGGQGRPPDLVTKIEKLAARAKEVLRDAPGSRVIPVLVTPRSPDLFTEGARERAASERVALITTDRLRQLVMLSTSNPPPSLVVDFLSGSIPSSYA